MSVRKGILPSMATEPEYGPSVVDHRAMLCDYLDFYRQVVTEKLTGLDEAELRRTRLPSGWTPVELLNHLIFMERRWLVWGFAGERVEAPWGDHANEEPDGPWVSPQDDAAALLAALGDGGRRTRDLVMSAELDDHAATGGRFATAAQAPTLAWILLHVLQEYARHAGHLDVARELADGLTGE